ncbi:hypothetical protein TVAG_206280 [Trichomonas vaginalis G3]|uniref:DUF3447 domain-containing protein n=1 Tax=Trichomonas vaginalis (strain ATCC PRA-98 / G3) TaxID=412133 RepID=A2E1L3_TRIV3|nr:protein ubiquitination [Trichomonas vaginalis G3]EAY13460.1 hypothetical protein TVAG_206280 [Trichomonas vaginalis G3]KAI5518345.1 protein ubiquitination [Trichomonas vaginalis G3]|eukprot:XP_001325683.1 hypothetical protein [Trichomonas vaginalis G3]
MSDDEIYPDQYSELRNICKDYIDLYNSLYQLKTKNEDELNSIFEKIKVVLIDSKQRHPENIIEDIFNIIPYNNRYTKSYLKLAKLISDEYNVERVNNLPDILTFLFHNEYDVQLCDYKDFEKNNEDTEFISNILISENPDIHTTNSIYKLIMDNDLKNFILFTERKEFNKNQKLECKLYPDYFRDYTLLELCCYYGSVDCFKFLRTEFHSEITQKCLYFSFLGGNPEIMSECLKYQKSNQYEYCMTYAIISHNIDFVTFLMNEFSLKIDLVNCIRFNNLEAFLVYFDQTNDFNRCLDASMKFKITSLCIFFSHCANVDPVLHIATRNHDKELVELLLSHGVNLNEKDKDGDTALNIAACNGYKDIAELLLSHGANIHEKDKYGNMALHIATYHKDKEIVELLLSHGANINEKDICGETALHIALDRYDKEIIELLLSYGANINEKNRYGKTPLQIATNHNNKEIVELFLSYGENINKKDDDREEYNSGCRIF